MHFQKYVDRRVNKIFKQYTSHQYSAKTVISCQHVQLRSTNAKITVGSLLLGFIIWYVGQYTKNSKKVQKRE